MFVKNVEAPEKVSESSVFRGRASVKWSDAF